MRLGLLRLQAVDIRGFSFFFFSLFFSLSKLPYLSLSSLNSFFSFFSLFSSFFVFFFLSFFLFPTSSSAAIYLHHSCPPPSLHFISLLLSSPSSPHTLPWATTLSQSVRVHRGYRVHRLKATFEKQRSEIAVCACSHWLSACGAVTRRLLGCMYSYRAAVPAWVGDWAEVFGSCLFDGGVITLHMEYRVDT